jgi:hypothetical protein
MSLQFKKIEEFEAQYKKEGIILIYEGRIYFTEKKKNDETKSPSGSPETGDLSFDKLASEAVKKAKTNNTNIDRTGIQLIFCREKENIFLTANRKIDVFKFAQDSSKYFKLIKEAIENK